MTAPDTDHGVEAPCCTEGAALTRRGLLQGIGGGLAATTMFGSTALGVLGGPAYAAPTLPGALPAAAGTPQNVVVVLSLSGGADMLSLVVPHGDPGYYRARSSIAVPRGALWAQDGFFGLHPALRPLQPWWETRRLAVVTGTGLPVPNRSHFAALEELEDAGPGDALRAGWLNRALGAVAGEDPQQGVHVGSGMLPTALAGPTPTLAVAELDATELNGPMGSHRRDRAAALRRMWGGTQGPLGDSARKALTVAADLRPVVGSPYAPSNGARYPATDLGDALKDAARLIRSGSGVRAITVDHGSWDMHAYLGDVDDPRDRSMRTMATGLAQGLAAFCTDLGSLLGSHVTVVTVSEFGRRVVENGSGGLDHGWGSAMLLLGAGVRGGRYLGRWPGLDAASLREGDLAVTTDYRSVLAEVVTRRLGVSSAAAFPGFTPQGVGAVV
ncbi:DUF1501 domain-containing protein [Nocardioidaceae bacterium]|nr:DUF1501 domain-containing protein [Nocardioidaceae bacterium]